MRIDDIDGIDGIVGIDVPIISVTDFCTNKLATGRLKDLADADALDGDKRR